MKRLYAALMLVAFVFLGSFAFAPSAQAAGADCTSKFFGLTPWYEYLETTPAPDCEIQIDKSNPNDFWLIGLAVIQLLLEVAGILAVVFVLFGGFRFVTSQGEPDKIANARTTIANALVGVVIAVIASNIVGYIAKALS